MRATAIGGRVSLVVADTGIGIAPEQQAIIFEPFRRVETGYARAQSGTGLGLALTRQLIELMDGTLALDSALGAGSAFTITFAVAAQAAGSGQQAAGTPVFVA